MPRPQKLRIVCKEPTSRDFAPTCKCHQSTVVLTVDEYETMRLIDYLDLTQEECASQMQVARTTVQGVYNQARKKLADAIVNGKRLIIEGGNYTVCSHSDKGCNGKACIGRKGCVKTAKKD